MADRRPAEVFPPGALIKEEMEARGWTQQDLAQILGKPLPTVNQILKGKKGIVAETARRLGAAFGNRPEFWMNLEASWQLYRVADSADPRNVRSRAKIFSLVPVRNMEKRGWIKPTASADSLKQELCRFFGVDSLDGDFTIAAATRRSMVANADEFTPAQRAWCFRAKQLGAALKVSAFKPNRISELKKKLRTLAAYPSEAQYVAELLGRFGVRFVVIEPFPGTGIDGVALWVDDASPVIGVSLRLNRIDSFWFTLMHELSHIEHGDAISLDVELTGKKRFPSEAKDPIERRADADASAFLVSPEDLDSFVRRIGPLYSKQKIVGFAHRIKIHPGIIVGQLQHLGEIGYNANREMLVRVRDIVANSSFTDGWGHTINSEVL